MKCLSLPSARHRQFWSVAAALFLLCHVTEAASRKTVEIKPRWWKGNLHTHTLWSDGDAYPETVVNWYKSHGYHFLALSDHNTLLDGEKWISITNNKGGEAAFKAYVAQFGKGWVKRRVNEGTNEVRLRTLLEFRLLFEKRNRFLLIPSEEITDEFQKTPVHLNVSNIRDNIPPQGGNTIFDVLQNNVRAALDQRMRSGLLMIPHVNHPNFGWAVTAEDLMRLEGEKFFEVYNGHPLVRNDGDSIHPGTERLWDIILSWRLGELGLEPVYGLAVDDAHNYHFNSPTNSNAGRGWVMVRAMQLTTPDILAALEAGDFYASTGVELKDIQRTNNQLVVNIRAEHGITYTTLFLGTRTGFSRESTPGHFVAGSSLLVTRQYSDEIGTILAEVDGTEARYTFKGNELYVRAKIISSKTKPNTHGELEICWTQPVIPQVGEALTR